MLGRAISTKIINRESTMRKFFVYFIMAVALSSFLVGCNDETAKQKEADKKFMNMDNIRDASKTKSAPTPR